MTSIQEHRDHKDPHGLLYDGYGLEVQGHEHQKNPNNSCESVVFLPRDTKFRVRLSNANDHECLVALDVDGIDIGTTEIIKHGIYLY